MKKHVKATMWTFVFCFVCVFVRARAKQSSNITANVYMSYHTRVQADIPRGFSGPRSDRPHSGALRAGRSSPDHTLKSHRETVCCSSYTHTDTQLLY